MVGKSLVQKTCIPEVELNFKEIVSGPRRQRGRGGTRTPEGVAGAGCR